VCSHQLRQVSVVRLRPWITGNQRKKRHTRLNGSRLSIQMPELRTAASSTKSASLLRSAPITGLRETWCSISAKTVTSLYANKQGCNEVRWRPGQEAGSVPPCSNLRSFGSKCTVLKKVVVTLFGLFGAPPPQWFGAPGNCSPLVTPLQTRKGTTSRQHQHDEEGNICVHSVSTLTPHCIRHKETNAHNRSILNSNLQKRL